MAHLDPCFLNGSLRYAFFSLFFTCRNRQYQHGWVVQTLLSNRSGAETPDTGSRRWISVCGKSSNTRTKLAFSRFVSLSYLILFYSVLELNVKVCNTKKERLVQLYPFGLLTAKEWQITTLSKLLFFYFFLLPRTVPYSHCNALSCL